jgi:hypothetical protein
VNPRGRVLAAGTLARVPSEGLALAVVLDVADRGGSVAFAGVLLALATLPQIVTGPLGGAALDATTRPGRVLAIACVAGAAAIGALAWAGSAGPVAIVAALVLAGSDPILTGGLSATFTRWADAARVPTHAISAWDGVAYNVAGVAGPLLVTVVAATAGSTAALVTLAALIVPAAALVWADPPLPPGEAHPGLRVTAALRAMWANRPLRGVTVASTVENGALGGLTIAMVAAAAAHGHAAEAAGTVLTVRAVAALAGSLVLTRYGRSIAAHTLVLASIAASGTGLVAMGIVPWWALVGLGGVVGLAYGPVLVGTYRARAEGSPAGLRASVFTVGASIKLAASSGGALVAGLALADQASAAGLAALGATSLLGAALGWWAARG